MNYKQQLIHEALQELERDIPSLLTHVTDVSSNWSDRSRDANFFLVYKGAAFIVQHHESTITWTTDTLRIWGAQKNIKEDPQCRKAWVGTVKKYLLSTIQHADKVMAEKERLGLKYPSLTS